MPAKARDLSWQRFGRLVALYQSGHVGKYHQTTWLCRCDCGNTKVITTSNLLRKEKPTQSCGCLVKEMARKHIKEDNPKKTHGKSDTRLYRIWKDMKRRTVNPKRQNYAWYGGRGIRVCDEWFNSFVTFERWARSHGYTDELSIDRIDPDGNYCPDNCRWSSKTEQANNRNSNRLFTYNGVTKTVAEWAVEKDIPYTLLMYRINAGWKPDRVFNKAGGNHVNDNRET